MDKEQKTNIAVLWIAILVLGISLMIDSYHDYQVHHQFRFQQKVNQELYLEHSEEETEHLNQVNQYLEQILNMGGEQRDEFYSSNNNTNYLYHNSNSLP